MNDLIDRTWSVWFMLFVLLSLWWIKMVLNSRVTCEYCGKDALVAVKHSDGEIVNLCSAHLDAEIAQTFKFN